MQASAPNLELAEPAKISLNVGVQMLDLQLKIVLAAEKVTVNANATPSVTTDSNSNASAQVLRSDDLDALSDNPEDLQAQLLATFVNCCTVKNSRRVTEAWNQHF